MQNVKHIGSINRWDLRNLCTRDRFVTSTPFLESKPSLSPPISFITAQTRSWMVPSGVGGDVEHVGVSHGLGLGGVVELDTARHEAQELAVGSLAIAGNDLALGRPRAGNS